MEPNGLDCLAWIWSMNLFTAVVVKILENNNKINSEMGRLTLEVLIVEYLAIVPMILTIKRIGWGNPLVLFRINTVLWVFICIGLFLSHQQKVKVLFSFSAGNLEFPALASIVFCLGFAALSWFLGLSIAHGAFLPGSDCHSRERNVMLQMMTPCEYVFFSFASAFSWT